MRDNYTPGEMEQIHRGLEEFLRRETEGMRSGQTSKSRGASAQREEAPREPQLFDVRDFQEDWDSKEHLQRVAARKKAEKARKKQEAYYEEPLEDFEEIEEAEEVPVKKNKKSKAKKKKKASKFKKFLFCCLLLLVIVAGGLYYVVGKVYSEVNYDNIESVEAAPVQDGKVTNILLIGNDSRSNDGSGRSDAMILLSVSHSTKKIYMTSLLRDMYVEIPGYKGNRLNAAYAYGGAELLMETIEQNFDIEVNRYVSVNFEAFANLVDAVGGVDLELSKEELEYVNAYLVEYNILTKRPEGTDYLDTVEGGLVHLNGPQALAYTRNRYIGTDFGRTERQRKVLSAIIKGMPKALVTNPKELIGGLLPNLTTNFTQGECYSLGFTAARALNYEIIQGSIPVEGSYKNATIRDMAVLEVDFEANKQFLQENVYGETP